MDEQKTKKEVSNSEHLKKFPDNKVDLSNEVEDQRPFAHANTHSTMKNRWQGNFNGLELPSLNDFPSMSTKGWLKMLQNNVTGSSKVLGTGSTLNVYPQHDFTKIICYAKNNHGFSKIPCLYTVQVIGELIEELCNGSCKCLYFWSEQPIEIPASRCCMENVIK